MSRDIKIQTKGDTNAPCPAKCFKFKWTRCIVSVRSRFGTHFQVVSEEKFRQVSGLFRGQCRSTYIANNSKQKLHINIKRKRLFVLPKRLVTGCRNDLNERNERWIRFGQDHENKTAYDFHLDSRFHPKCL